MSILLKFLSIKFVANILLRSVLRIHTLSYKLSGFLAVIVNSGVHPKHQIMRHKEWFLDNILENWVVLDVGCNTGMMPEVMSSKANYIYGIEIERKHIEEAQRLRQKSNIEYICADATTYDYSECKLIDVVTLSNVLEHIEHRVIFLKKLVSQVAWKNESSKRLLIRVPMIDREWITVYKKKLGLEYRLDNTHFTEYSFEQFEQEMIQSGIAILSYYIRFGEIYAVCKAN